MHWNKVGPQLTCQHPRVYAADDKLTQDSPGRLEEAVQLSFVLCQLAIAPRFANRLDCSTTQPSLLLLDPSMHPVQAGSLDTSHSGRLSEAVIKQASNKCEGVQTADLPSPCN